MRAKKYREEIYRGSGVGSALGKPYVPFEVGVGFQESSQECEKQVSLSLSLSLSPGLLNMLALGPSHGTNRVTHESETCNDSEAYELVLCLKLIKPYHQHVPS